MPTHPSVLLQTKLYELLTGSQRLQQLGCGVFDSPQDSQTYPYVTIEHEYDDWGSHDEDGFDATVTLHTWTQALGKKQALDIQSELYELLHNTNLGIRGHKTIVLRAGLTTTTLDPDGRTYHGVSVFKLILGGSNG